MSLQTWGLRSTKKRGNSVGLTLIEIVLSGAILTFTASAFLRAYLSQVTLNEHTRNSSLALFDANRVMEQLRRQNVGCNTPW
ncbi:MAG: hypothetical protein HYU33_07860 [Candidatus Omnitrophica bacterium]|nr:hypothetical protein [Candidatus Omnitrophota bacterium]